MSTDIIIVSYHDEEKIKTCLFSIKEHCNDYELIVEDNNKINRGFTKAVNAGIKKGKSDFVWLLNSDAVVLEGAQQALIDRFSQQEKIGIVGSMQIDPLNTDRIAFGGARQAFPNGIHKGGLISMGHCRFPEKQTWVNGASMMIRRKMIEQIGLLDESMHLLFSDSDYCYEARLAGWSIWYEPRSKVLHTLGKASKTASEWQRKDMEAFMKKWGIKINGDQIVCSRKFQKLDMFP